MIPLTGFKIRLPPTKVRERGVGGRREAKKKGKKFFFKKGLTKG